MRAVLYPLFSSFFPVELGAEMTRARLWFLLLFAGSLLVVPCTTNAGDNYPSLVSQAFVPPVPINDSVLQFQKSESETSTSSDLLDPNTSTDFSPQHLTLEKRDSGSSNTNNYIPGQNVPIVCLTSLKVCQTARLFWYGGTPPFLICQYMR
jgi:hypothetical protein